MARRCEICGKGPVVGRNISHAHNVSARRFEPNLQRVRALVNGGIQRLRVYPLYSFQQGRQGSVTIVRNAVSTPLAPAAIGPYSQAIRAGSLLFVSGQVPIDLATGALVTGTIGDQTRRVLHNVGEILKAAGASFDHVVRTTVYLADIGDFAAMNEAYSTFFTAPAPARSTIQAARLPRDARVEIDVIASFDV